MASFCLLSALFRHTRSFAFRRKETVKISVFIHFSNVKRKVFYLIIFIVVSELYKNGNDQTGDGSGDLWCKQKDSPHINIGEGECNFVRVYKLERFRFVFDIWGSLGRKWAQDGSSGDFILDVYCIFRSVFIHAYKVPFGIERIGDIFRLWSRKCSVFIFGGVMGR